MRVSNKLAGAKPVLLAQQPEVVISVVKNDLDGGIGQNRTERIQVGYRQRIDYGRLDGGMKAGGDRPGRGSDESSRLRYPQPEEAPG